MVIYDGVPLYYYVKDAKPGDVTGEGVQNITWHVVKP
jgi:predicted lipoprotein with Yx(FWY)xxD motif